MLISFQKMHANGDDFVIVDIRGQASIMDGHIARRLGDRNRGIGFNQLAVMSDCEDAAAYLTFWNSDGSTLDVCGSAMRGVAWKLLQETNETSVVVRTNRGLHICTQAIDGQIFVNMGAPLTDWRDIPIAYEVDTLHLPLPGAPSACSMGNPHCTYFVDDVEAVRVEAVGAEIEKHPMFPKKTNVHFVQVLSETHIRLRIWERGGGVPLGSGSCSCGAAVNGIRRGLLGNSVEVECDGGRFTVQWDGVGSVLLKGPVEQIFSGVWSDQVMPNS